MGEGTGPEDGAEEAAGVVRPESLGGGFGVLPAAAGGAAAAAAAAGAASALLLVVGGGGGAEEDGLVDLRLAERERQQGPRRVSLRRRQQRRRHVCGAGWRSRVGSWGLLRGRRRGPVLVGPDAGGFYTLCRSKLWVADFFYH